MGRTARDDFSAPTRQKLAERVGYICSNPGCRNGTVGPAGTATESVSIGVAAHICAASKGGPRFDSNQTPTERSSIENGIWLCHSCSRRIDGDFASYPREVLQEWKQISEERARQHLVESHITEAVVQQRMKSMLSIVSNPQALNAVTSVHRATEAFLSGKDGRIAVKSSFGPEGHVLELVAKEKVDVKFRLSGNDMVAIAEAMAAMAAHGEAVSIEFTDLRLSGSALLEYLTEDQGPGRLELTPVTVPAMLTMSLIPPDGASTENINFEGTAVAGRQSVTVRGELYGGAVAVAVRVYVEGERRRTVDLSFDVSTTAWNGKDVRLLPHLEKTFELLSRLLSDWSCKLDVFAYGKTLEPLELARLSQLPLLRTHAIRLAYACNALAISRHLKRPIPFVEGHGFKGDEYNALQRAAHAVSGTLVAPDSAYDELVDFVVSSAAAIAVVTPTPGHRINLLTRFPRGERISVFGVPVDLPPLVGNMLCDVVEVTPSDDGQRYRVTARKVSGFASMYSFTPPASSAEVELLSTEVPGLFASIVEDSVPEPVSSTE